MEGRKRCKTDIRAISLCTALFASGCPSVRLKQEFRMLFPTGYQTCPTLWSRKDTRKVVNVSVHDFFELRLFKSFKGYFHWSTSGRNGDWNVSPEWQSSLFTEPYSGETSTRYLQVPSCLFLHRWRHGVDHDQRENRAGNILWVWVFLQRNIILAAS